MKTIEKAEKAWSEYKYKDIPQVSRTAFLEGFVEGYNQKLREIHETIDFHNNPENE